MIKTPLSTVIGGAFWTPGATVINGKKIFNDFIKSLFADGSQGIYLNAQDAASVSDLSSIKDLSGRGNHAVQANATSRASLITDPSGYKSLKFDGIDDGYVTQSIDFTGTDKVTVIAAVRKLSDVVIGTVVELGVTTNNGTFLITTGRGTDKNMVSFAARGSALIEIFALQGLSPVSSVITTKSDVSDQLAMLKVNNAKVTSSNSQGNGNYGNYPLYIGRRGAPSLPFNGQIYALLIIGKLLDDATTAKIEKEFAKYIGVTL